MGADQALKRQFLVRAKALCEQPEVFRCVAVTQLIGEMVAFGVHAEAEVFQAVYGDPIGRKWEAHLSEAIPAAKLAHVLAVHLAENAERISVWKSAILLAIRDAADAGERASALSSFRSSNRSMLKCDGPGLMCSISGAILAPALMRYAICSRSPRWIIPEDTNEPSTASCRPATLTSVNVRRLK
jgi:hypothetical protein